MYKTLLCCIALALSSAIINGQKSSGGRPYSDLLPALKSASAMPEIKLSQFDIHSLDTQMDDEPVRYGVFTDTIINLRTSGKEDVIASKGKIWRLKISNANARSVQLFFKTFLVPEGASLFLYDDHKKNIAGAFNCTNMRGDSMLIIADFKGNHVIAEYFEPDEADFKGSVIIGSIGQAFRDVLQPQSGTGSFININCPIGKYAQLDKHAVGRMAFRSGQYQVTCSGALVNNAKNDGIPYFLTANHCLSTQSEASTLTVYFNYEVAGCDGDTLTSSVLAGSTLLSTAQPSDYSLLRLNEQPFPSHQPYYAGWDARDMATSNVTAVHYPFGNTKKISLDYDSIKSNELSVTWDDDSRSPRGSHWIIGFDEGSTSQGSSGSPLFNSDHQIIGQLHGGDDAEAYYGKFSYSYTHKPSNYPSIAHYLDPDSTGVLVVNGYSPATNIPDAFFTTDFEQVCMNAPITFNDFSVFGPFARSWSISPASFTYLNGTSDTSANPVIQFNSDAVYHVKLDLLRSNSVVSSENLEIVSGDNLDINVRSNKPGDLCDCDFESLNLQASGASDFTWSIASGDENKIQFSRTSGDTTTMTKIPGFVPQSTYTVNFNVIGTQATCSDTIAVSYDVLKPENDEIANAAVLEYGMSDYFTNICASVEENEPVPPFTSCTSQDSWCDEYGTGEDIVENSVWFKFVAGATGKVSISSTGFDNQVALYQAVSAEEILAGNYTILGANDDRTDSDFRPLIISETVTPGKTYWIQVDGSGGGLEDEFYITLTELSATTSNDPISRNMVVYPVPAVDVVFLNNSDWIEHEAEVLVYNTSGTMILAEKMEIKDQEISVQTNGWEAGIYIIRIITDSREFIARIVKK